MRVEDWIRALVPGKRERTLALWWATEESFFNCMGARDMIPESVAGAVPFIGAVVGSIALFNTVDLLRMWDKKQAEKKISGLESFVPSGDSVFFRNLHWGDSQNRLPPIYNPCWKIPGLALGDSR